jgi:hypothetical protein
VEVGMGVSVFRVGVDDVALGSERRIGDVFGG